MLSDAIKIESIQKNENQILVSFTLHIESSVFKGHFPDRPVLPGVLQLQLLKVVLEKELQLSLILKESANIKYLIPIVPEYSDAFSMQITYGNSDNQIKAEAVIRNQDQVFTKMNCLYAES